MKIPAFPHPKLSPPEPYSGATTIVVWPEATTKRPVGYAPWPDQPKPKAKRKPRNPGQPS